jgi:hypothetical protein
MKMDYEVTILYLSDCCGAYMSDEHICYEVCPDCKDHCEVVIEEYPVENGMLFVPSC